MKKVIKIISILIIIGLILMFIYNIMTKNSDNDIKNSDNTSSIIESSVDIKQIDIKVEEDTKLPVGK